MPLPKDKPTKEELDRIAEQKIRREQLLQSTHLKLERDKAAVRAAQEKKKEDKSLSTWKPKPINRFQIATELIAEYRSKGLAIPGKKVLDQKVDMRVAAITKQNTETQAAIAKLKQKKVSEQIPQIDTVKKATVIQVYHDPEDEAIARKLFVYYTRKGRELPDGAVFQKLIAMEKEARQKTLKKVEGELIQEAEKRVALENAKEYQQLGVQNPAEISSLTVKQQQLYTQLLNKYLEHSRGTKASFYDINGKLISQDVVPEDVLLRDAQNMIPDLKNPDKITKALGSLEAWKKDSLKTLYHLGNLIDALSNTDNTYWKKIYKDLTKIFIKNTEVAIKHNYDLNVPAKGGNWGQHLLRVIKENPVVQITPSFTTEVQNLDLGNGKTFKYDRIKINTYTVDIRTNMEAFCGTADDYADAVKAARITTGIGNSAADGKSLTLAWYYRLFEIARYNGKIDYNVYKYNYETVERRTKSGAIRKIPHKVGKGQIVSRKTNTEATERLKTLYWDIMKARLEFMKNKAPYWVLLNDGAIKLSSDKGGFERTGSYRPEHFVENSERDILKKLTETTQGVGNKEIPSITQQTIEKQQVLEEQMQSWQNQIKHYNVLIPILKDLLKIASAGLSKVMTTLTKTFDITGLAAFQEAITATEKNKELLKITKAKINLLVLQVASGQEVAERTYFFSRKGKVVRPRTRELSKTIKKYLDDFFTEQETSSEARELFIKESTEQAVKINDTIKALEAVRKTKTRLEATKKSVEIRQMRKELDLEWKERMKKLVDKIYDKGILE